MRYNSLLHSSTIRALSIFFVIPIQSTLADDFASVRDDIFLSRSCYRRTIKLPQFKIMCPRFKGIPNQELADVASASLRDIDTKLNDDMDKACNSDFEEMERFTKLEEIKISKSINSANNHFELSSAYGKQCDVGNVIVETKFADKDILDIVHIFNIAKIRLNHLAIVNGVNGALDNIQDNLSDMAEDSISDYCIQCAASFAGANATNNEAYSKLIDPLMDKIDEIVWPKGRPIPPTGVK